MKSHAPKHRKKPAAKPPAGPSRGRGPRATSARPSLARPSFITLHWDRKEKLPDRDRKRVYQLDSLETAIANLVRQKDCWLLRGIQQALGEADVTSLRLRPEREDEHALFIEIQAANAARQRAAFTLQAARNDKECAVALKARIAALQTPRAVLGECVLETYRSGILWVPGKHGPARPVFACLAARPEGYLLAAWKSHQQICVLDPLPRALSLRETEHLRGCAVEWTLRCFDPVKRTGIAPPSLRRSEIMVRRERGGVAPLLIRATPLVGRPSPARLLSLLLTGEQHAGADPPWRPGQAEEFIAKICLAAGTLPARSWLDLLLRRTEAGQLPPIPQDYLAALRDFVLK